MQRAACSWFRLFCSWHLVGILRRYLPYLPRMWQPGVPVTSETPLEPLLCAIGFGLQDVASYQTIAEKLKTRSVSTVGDLFGSGASWQREEVLACFRTLELKKTPLCYVGAIEGAVQKTTERCRFPVWDWASQANSVGMNKKILPADRRHQGAVLQQVPWQGPQASRRSRRLMTRSRPAPASRKELLSE